MTLPAGLSGLGPLLGLDSGDKVHVLSRVHIFVAGAGGPLHRQLLRATPMFRGSAWYDHIAYRPQMTILLLLSVLVRC